MAADSTPVWNGMSWRAISRGVEEYGPAVEKRLREQGIETHGIRPRFSDVRALSDDEIVGRLRVLGVEMDRQRLVELSGDFLSAQEMTEGLVEKHKLKLRGLDVDWLWIYLAVLWERWLPKRPSMEMIDDRMQEGYQKLKEKDRVGGCEIWLRVWVDILRIMDDRGMTTLAKFDEVFRGTQLVDNWVQDLELELGNAALDEKRFCKRGISFCEEYLIRFQGEDSDISRNMRRAMAKEYSRIGKPEKTDTLYAAWLKDDPTWGWGWIGWSDCYQMRSRHKDSAKAERILKEGLAVLGVEDREHLLGRLADVYNETDRFEEAEEVYGQLNELEKKFNQPFHGQTNIPPLTPVEWVLPIWAETSKVKIGRNEPCPCGSGKKYKKCCGKPV